MRRKIIRKRKSSVRRKNDARKARLPAAPNEPFGSLVSANARALGIEIDPSWERGVTFNLQLIFSHAARVDGLALPEDTEPAAIFHA